ncbi:MAG: (Fe-S)-binding protein [Rhodocyclaceae bacterium]|nr:(Fe-S)-binding protein [Rhodocyclaceae bacterium]
MPSRQTFGLLPPDTEFAMYLALVPFALVFCIGVYLRFRAAGLARLLINAPSGIGCALGRLLQYGFGQRRVAQRPRGWPHLAIFYGFLTLLFGSVMVAADWDVFQPLGSRILLGTPYLYLETLLDALGLVFVAGLSVALIWRLLKLPGISQDQRPLQWQFLLLGTGLLYMGVTGFLLEGLRLTLTPVPWADWSFVGYALTGTLRSLGVTENDQNIYVILWWSHALVAFSLIAALPYSALLHALAAPANLMLHSGRPQLGLDTPFDLRQIAADGNFDVKAGVATLADFSQVQRFVLMACTDCGRCDDACPGVASGTVLSPRRLVQGLRARQLANAAATDLLASGTVSAEAVWACTTCGACVTACPVFIQPVDYIVPMRRELLTRQQADKRQIELLGNLGRNFNPYGLPAANRAQLAAELAASNHTS